MRWLLLSLLVLVKKMLKQYHIFLTAVMFFTRIPVPKSLPYSKDYLNKASRYFPMMGWLVGGVAALVFWACHHWFPMNISIALSMVASILMTGAFHEDGFADMCDGFGGGYTQEKILEIMKDSRLGTYGAVGLGFVLFLKWSSLSHLKAEQIPIILLIGHSLSRLASTSLIQFSQYAREDEKTKAKPLATEMGWPAFIFASVCGIAPLLTYGSWTIWAVLLPVALMTLYLNRFFNKWIGGYTGDCLGAVQQATEVVIYLSILGMTWTSI